jgi:hypothetical protein
MLWKLTTTNKYGNLRSRIVHTEGALTIGRGFGPFVGAKRFRYESRTPYHGILPHQLMVKNTLPQIGLKFTHKLHSLILFTMLQR